MKQYEAVIKVMEENGGFATLGYLYEHVLKIENCKWKTLTPFASIRRIVQNDRFFFKIKPGLWALNKYRNKISKELPLSTDHSDRNQSEYNHTYFQGLLVEIGNIKNYKTIVPGQDKNKKFLGKKLKDITSIDTLYQFSYKYVLDKAKTIDVIWFNERNFPAHLFEVEHTTNIKNSLLKFLEFQDFRTSYYIVADIVRKREFENQFSYTAFNPIKNQIKFIDYESLSNWHAKSHEVYIYDKILTSQNY